MRYGDKVAVDGLSLTVERAHDHRRPRPQRRRQDHHAGDLRGLPPAPARARSGCSGSTRCATAAALLPRIGVMLQDGGAWSGVRAMEMLRHIARLHAHPLDVDAARRAARARRLRADAVPPALRRPAAAARPGDGAGRPPGARVRRRADRRAWTRRPGATTWELLEELRADGVTVVLTTHYMDEAERLADRIHIIDRGRLIACGSPLELTRGGAVGDDPAGRHPAVPARAPRSRCAAALGAGHRGDPARRAQPAGHRPGRRLHAGQGVRAGARSTACCRSR